MLIYMPTLQLSIILNNIMDSDFQQIIQECNAFLVQLENNTTNSLMYTGKASDQIKKPFIRKLVQAQMDANQIFSLLSFEMYQEMLQRITKNIVEFIKQFIQKNKKEQLGKNPEIFFGIKFSCNFLQKMYEQNLEDNLKERNSKYKMKKDLIQSLKHEQQIIQTRLQTVKSQYFIKKEHKQKIKAANICLMKELQILTIRNAKIKQDLLWMKPKRNYYNKLIDMYNQTRQSNRIDKESFKQRMNNQRVVLNRIFMNKNELYSQYISFTEITLRIFNELFYDYQDQVPEEQFIEHLKSYDKLTIALIKWNTYRYPQIFVDYNFQFLNDYPQIGSKRKAKISLFKIIFSKLRQIKNNNSHLNYKYTASEFLCYYEILQELISLLSIGYSWGHVLVQILKRKDILIIAAYLQKERDLKQINKSK